MNKRAGNRIVRRLTLTSISLLLPLLVLMGIEKLWHTNEIAQALDALEISNATQVITAAIASDPGSLDPAINQDSNAFLLAAQIYDTLAVVRPASSLVEPGLAESWSVSGDGKLWTFTLRSGVQFHDGTELNGAAVVDNLRRLWDPTHPQYIGTENYAEALLGGPKGDVNSILSDTWSTSATNIFFALRHPYSPLPSLLASPVFSIASPAAIQAGMLATAPVGTGPFIFVEKIDQESIRLQANPGYWQGSPSIDLVFQVIPDTVDQLTALQNGSVQAAYGIDDTTALTATSDPNLQVLWRLSNAIGYLGINRAQSPLANDLVRRAIAHAINRKYLLDTFHSAGDLQASQLLPPVIWGHDPSIADYDYDPGLALELLATAGYTDGFTTTLSFRSATRAYLPDPAGTAQAIADDLAAVGIDAQVVEYDAGTFYDKYLNGELDLFLLGWTMDFPHPDNFLKPLLCDSVPALGPRDDILCDALDANLAEPDPYVQLLAYQSAAQRVHETVPLLPIRWPQTALLLRAEVSGVAASATGYETYQNAHIDDAFRIRLPAEPVELDPAVGTDASSFMLAWQLYDRLTTYDPESAEIVPSLATTWTVSTDGLTWSFTLRPGVKFHDGSNADAEAVLFNLERWWDPAHPYHDHEFEYFRTLFSGYRGDPNALISGLSTAGESQLVIQLSRPNYLLPYILGTPAMSIASPAAIQQGILDRHPVGSGPFQFLYQTPGMVSLERFTDYWGGSPSLARLDFRSNIDDATALAALQLDTLQAAYGISDTWALSIAEEPSLQLLWHPIPGTGYLGINRAHTPLDDPLVRQAIAHAVNRQGILNTFSDPGDLPAEQFAPPTAWGFNPAVTNYAYNPTLAQDLLDQAGYSSGFMTTLAYRSVPRAYLPDPEATAQALAADLAAVGIDATVIEYDSGTFIDKYANGELDLFLLGWTMDYPHANNFYYDVLCSTSANGFGPKDDLLCGNLELAQATGDEAARLAIYQSAAQRIHDTLPLLPIRWPQTSLVLRSDVTGVTPTPLEYGSYYNARRGEATQTAIDPDIGSTLTYTDTTGGTTTVQVPGGAVSETTILRLTAITLTEVPTGYSFAGAAFELEAIQGGFIQEEFQFSEPVTLTLEYLEADIAGLDELDLRLYYLDGGLWRDVADTCTPASVYERHPDQNQLSIALCHLSTFALFDPKSQLYVPLLRR